MLMQMELFIDGIGWCQYMFKGLKYYWKYIIDATQVLISVGTFILAMLIYKRFSFKNKVLEKQFEEVCELIDKLKVLEIRVETVVESNGSYIAPADGITHVSFYFYNMGKSITNKNVHHLFKPDAQLLFTEKYLNENLLIGLELNPFMPNEIADKIEHLNKGAFNYYKDRNLHNGKVDEDGEIAIICNNSEGFEEDKKMYNLKYKFRGGKLARFEDFYNSSIELNNAIKTWLKKYDGDNINLR
jgi:hypothetical protein